MSFSHVSDSRAPTEGSVGTSSQLDDLSTRTSRGSAWVAARALVNGGLLAAVVLVLASHRRDEDQRTGREPVPFRWDGMSLALLEAMARGRSIVATDVPGLRDAVRGGTGAVVPVERPHELARALLARLLDPALTESEGRTARELVERHHDLRRTTERTSFVYDEVLHPRQRAVGHPLSNADVARPANVLLRRSRRLNPLRLRR